MSNTVRGSHFDVFISIGGSKLWRILQFGRDIDRTKWNQFTFTVDDDVGACLYINGAKVECNTSPISVSYDITSNDEMRIGASFSGGSQIGAYVDDFAIWKAVLTDDEIQTLYNKSQ